MVHNEEVEFSNDIEEIAEIEKILEIPKVSEQIIGQREFFNHLLALRNFLIKKNSPLLDKFVDLENGIYEEYFKKIHTGTLNRFFDKK